MEKKTNKAKLEIFKFLRKLVLSICDENGSKSYDFHEKCKRIEE